MSNTNENSERVVVAAKSLETALEECQVDLQKWDVDHYTIKENSKGHSFDIYLKKKAPQLQDLEAIKRELSGFTKMPTKIEYKRRDNGLLLEFAPFDLHWGKYAWGEETGESYDMKIAAAALNRSIDYTLGVASKFNISKIVFPFGQDFFQVDNEQNTTSAGTPQDTDSRFKKVVREGRKIVISTIEKLRQCAPVEVIIVSGNHGRMSEFMLGDLLEVKYEKDDCVTVNNSPMDRKYLTFGKNLILYTHGDQERVPNLPMIMATEAAKDWSRCTHRYVKLGHLHQERLRELYGVKIEHLPSLSATDAWHKRKGYVANTRGVASSIYDPEMGQINKIYFNL